MQRTRRILRGLGLVAVGAIAWLGAESAEAACTVDPCLAGGSALFDCDRDGYTDAEECSGLTAPPAAFAFPSCRSAPGPNCLDPRVADVFVLFVKAPGSLYDALGITNQQAFAAVTQTGGGGLPQRVHVLNPATTTLLPGQGGQAVTARQSAFRVREVLSSPTGCPMTASLGFTPGGGVAPSLNQGKEALVYTQRIVNHVSCVYTDAGVSPTSAAATQDKIAMIQHTTAHELTHNQRMAPDDVSRFGGHHYKTGTGCVMDQAVTYSTRKGVTFDTSLTYCAPSQAAAADGQTGFGALLCEDPDDVIDGDGFTVGCLPTTP
jgi:hypothetical protein